MTGKIYVIYRVEHDAIGWVHTGVIGAYATREKAEEMKTSIEKARPSVSNNNGYWDYLELEETELEA